MPELSTQQEITPTITAEQAYKLKYSLLELNSLFFSLEKITFPEFLSDTDVLETLNMSISTQGKNISSEALEILEETGIYSFSGKCESAA